MRSDRLGGKHVLLTGGRGGIGLAVTGACLAAGAHCTVVDMPTNAGDELGELQTRYPTRLVYHAADITRTERLSALVDEATRQFGPIHALFNNAGVFAMAPLLASDERMYQRLFDVNVKGMFFVMQAVLAHMLQSGVRGSVINLSSQAGRRGEPLLAHYCATKAAVISYTQSAAIAMASHGIRVNAISPGAVLTPMWDTVDAMYAKYEQLEIGDKKKAVGRAVPMGRMGVPQDIVGLAVFLFSNESSYITAQTINVDGGSVMS
jgi:D-sorbitol dehydrogenase (acceptor)